METIFIAYGFTEPNKLIVKEIDEICHCYGIRSVSGAVLGGEGLGPAVRERIRQCDALIALATREAPLANAEGWETHQWVRDEFSHAHALSIQTVAVVERGVRWGGMHRDLERIDFEREHRADMLLRLMNTIGLWKQKSGRCVKLRLELDNVSPRHLTSVQYRFVHRGSAGDWHPANISIEPGGAFVYARGVTSDDQAVEIVAETSAPFRKLCSVATPQVVPVTLSEV